MKLDSAVESTKEGFYEFYYYVAKSEGSCRESFEGRLYRMKLISSF